MDKEIHRFVFSFNPKANGGEQFLLITKYIDNGDKLPLVRQEFVLNSYCNAASFNIEGVVLSSVLLRELADHLDTNNYLAFSKNTQSKIHAKKVTKKGRK